MTQTCGARIAYSVKGASEQVGLSQSLIREAVRDGDIEPRYARTKTLIEHDELVRWVRELPTEKPGTP